MSATMTKTVSPDVANEMADILGEGYPREVYYEETQDVVEQVRMTVPTTLTPLASGVCAAGPCC